MALQVGTAELTSAQLQPALGAFAHDGEAAVGGSRLAQ